MHTEKYTYSHLMVGIMVILGQIIIILFPIIFCYFFYFNNSINFSFFAIFFILINGTRMRALGNIIHECSHFNYLKSKKQNYFIGKILAILEFSCFDKYLKDHYTHHKFLGDLRYDEDFKSRQIIGICRNEKINIKMLLKVVCSPRNWLYILKSSFIFDLKDRTTIVIRIIYFFCLGSLIFFFGFYLVFLFIILPYLTTYQMCKIFSDYLDHGGLYHHHNQEYKTRNHYFSLPFLNWLLFPRNDCYHLIHHLYPRIPTKNLHKVHKLLLTENPEYAQRRHKIF